MLLATINLPKSLTFLRNFCKGVKIYHFSSKIIFGQVLLTFGDFFWSHWFLVTKRVSTLFQKSLSCRLLNSHSGKYNSISKYNNQVLTPRWGRRDLLNGLLEQGEACSPARPWWHPARACNPPAASRRQSRNRRPSPRRKRTRFCPSPSSASARTMAADEAPKLFDRFWSWSPFMFILFSGLNVSTLKWPYRKAFMVEYLKQNKLTQVAWGRVYSSSLVLLLIFST